MTTSADPLAAQVAALRRQVRFLYLVIAAGAALASVGWSRDAAPAPRRYTLDDSGLVFRSAAGVPQIALRTCDEGSTLQLCDSTGWAQVTVTARDGDRGTVTLGSVNGPRVRVQTAPTGAELELADTPAARRVILTAGAEPALLVVTPGGETVSRVELSPPSK